MKSRRLSFSAGMVCLGLLAPAASAAADARIEAGFGLAHGDHDLTISENIESFDLSIDSDSTLNGSGPVAAIGLWVDGLFLKNLSLGLEYLRLENTADLGLTARSPDQSLDLDADFELNVDAIMVNAAYRRNSGAIHPYLALGIGAARVAGDVDGDIVGSPGMSETSVIDFSDSDYTPAGQITVGLDYDVTERLYIGASARYFVIDTRLFEHDEVIRELAAMIKLGISF